MKKTISFLLSLAVSLILSTVCFAKEASVNFVNGGEYITAVSTYAESVDIDGTTGWKIPVDSYYYINCKIDNLFLYDISDESSIKVKYYDGSDGKFCIQYADNNGNSKYTETVVLSGSNKWKMYTFNLTDCAYNDGILGYDFRITLQDNDGRSTSPIVFSDVAVSVQDIEYELVTDTPGHVFSNNEPVEFNLMLKNITSELKQCTISANVYNQNGDIFRKKIINSNIPAEETVYESVSFTGLSNGFYNLKLNVAYGAQVDTLETRFSVSSVSENNLTESIFGTCLHISGIKADSDEMNSMMSMLKKSGVDWIRDEYYWNAVEKEKGVYDFYADDYINNCIENNINPMVLLSYSNDLYGGVPHDEAGYQGFANYAKAVASHLKGKVKVYEVWNEWNGGTWSGGYGTEEYANILKYTYKALKEVDPEITVVAGATIMADTAWFNELFSIALDGKSMYEYCDAISYHPYRYPNTPDALIESGNIENNAFAMYNMMKKYGEPKPQYISEIGWFTGTAEKSVSPENQAAYLARTYISGMAYGVDKIFWYDFKDDGTDLAESEYNYGIINSWDAEEEIKYEPKPAFLATATVTSILKGTEYVKEYRPNGNIRIYKFVNEEENKEVHVMYTADNSEIDFLLTGDNLKLKCYDIYGNECRIKSLSGSPMYVESEIGGFDVNEIMTNIRSDANATFGEDYRYSGIRVITEEVPTTQNSRNVFAIAENDGILCDIDDSWVFEKAPVLKFSVNYYDIGWGSFKLLYKDGEGNIKYTEPVDIKKIFGEGLFKTAEFIIEDLWADNSLSGGDFEIMTDNCSGKLYFIAVKAKEINSGTPVLVAEFDNSEFSRINEEPLLGAVQFDGMSIYPHDNASGGFKYVTKNGRGGLYVPSKNEGYYISVNLDDEVYFGGVNDITISVDYFDEGNGNFDIAYDAGSYTIATPANNVVYLQNSGEWKTADFTVNKSWFENHGMDFRIALWTGSMTTSPEGVTFGGIRVENNLDSPDFNLSYDMDTNKVKISGYFRKTSDDSSPVTVQILKQDMVSSDLSEVTSMNVEDYLRYVSQASVSDFYNFKYYEKEFEMDDSTGVYLVRVRLPEENIILEKYLYYYNLYDIDKLIIRDKNGEILNSEQIMGIDYFDATMGVLSNYEDMELCMVAAVYDEDGHMKAVNMVESDAVAGEKSELKTSVSLASEIESGYKVKILILKNITSMIPLTNAHIINIE